MSDFDSRRLEREERDRLLEYKRLLCDGNIAEALRLIDKRLATIQEDLES